MLNGINPFINPHSFKKFVILAFVTEIGKEIGVEAFAFSEWLSNGGRQILINCFAQYVTYVATQAVGNAVKAPILLPILANPKVAYDFVSCSTTLATQPEKAALTVLIFTAAGLATKGGDVAIGGLISNYIEAMKSASSGSDSFISPMGSSPYLYLRLLNSKQRRKVTVIFNLMIISGIVCIVVTFVVAQKLLKAYRKLLIKSSKLGKSIGHRIRNRIRNRKKRKKLKYQTDILFIEA